MKSELSQYCAKMSPNKSSRTDKVRKIVIHHMAGILSAKECENIFANPKRQASANYLIGKNGEILCNVDENERAWTSGSRWLDMQAITIEVSNCKGAPGWEVSDTCINSLIALCKDICNRYSIVPTFTGDTNGTICFHCMVQATACPGPYIKKNIGRIVDAIKEGKPTNTIPENQNAVNNDASFFKVKVTCNCLNIRKGPGTTYKSVGQITDKGVYTIVETQGKWGKLKSGKGWIYLSYTKRV